MRLRLRALAVPHPTLHGLLRAQGQVVNPKRVYRIYGEEDLPVRTKRRKKLARPRVPMPVPASVNQRCSVDFMSAQLSNGRRFRILNVVDDFSRECVVLTVPRNESHL